MACRTLNQLERLIGELRAEHAGGMALYKQLHLHGQEAIGALLSELRVETQEKQRWRDRALERGDVIDTALRENERLCAQIADLRGEQERSADLRRRLEEEQGRFADLRRQLEERSADLRRRLEEEQGRSANLRRQLEERSADPKELSKLKKQLSSTKRQLEKALLDQGKSAELDRARKELDRARKELGRVQRLHWVSGDVCEALETIAELEFENPGLEGMLRNALHFMAAHQNRDTLKMGVFSPGGRVKRLEPLDIPSDFKDTLRRAMHERSLALFEAPDRCADFMRFFETQNAPLCFDAKIPYLDVTTRGFELGRFASTSLNAATTRELLEQLTRKGLVLAAVPEDNAAKFTSTFNEVLTQTRMGNLEAMQALNAALTELGQDKLEATEIKHICDVWGGESLIQRPIIPSEHASKLSAETIGRLRKARINGKPIVADSYKVPPESDLRSTIDLLNL
jgi:hypothetical protein